MQRPSPLRLAFLAVACVGALFVVAYAAHGPFDSPFRAHTPLNGVLFVAVPCLLLLLLSPSPAASPSAESGPRWHLAAAVLLTLCAYLASLPFPFVSDGCTHTWWAAHRGESPFRVLGELLSSPQEGRFYRPISFFSYYLHSSWAAVDPARWRLLNVLLHCANTALIYPLGRRLGFSHRIAIVSVLLFGLHGTRPEAVVWVGAHFEVITTLFVFLSAWLWLRSNILLSLFASLVAFLCKESAFALPPILTLLAIARRGERPWLRSAVSTAPWYLLAALVFAWRWHLLHGIGGYTDQASGRLTILNFSPLHTAKALLLRTWTILVVPVNWSHRAESWLTLALLLGLATLIYVTLRASIPRSVLGCLAAAVVIAVLPSQHLALVGQGMDGSRIFYIASAPFCILLALAADSAARPAPRFLLVSAALVLLQAAALAHNMRIWGDVARLADASVSAAARASANHPGPVSFRAVPNVLDGIYFLESGLPSCLAIRGAGPLNRFLMETPVSPLPPGALILEWDSAQRAWRSEAR